MYFHFTPVVLADWRHDFLYLFNGCYGSDWNISESTVTENVCSIHGSCPVVGLESERSRFKAL